MKKSLLLFSMLLLFGQVFYAFPINDFDYHIAENTVSPVTAAMGGMNVTNLSDAAIIYNNAALLSYRKDSSMILAGRIYAEEGDDFDSLISSSNTLRKTQLNYFSFTLGNGGFAYQSLAKVDDEKSWQDSLSHKQYHDYSLDSYQFGFAEKNDIISYGMNLKYLHGRLVHLSQTMQAGFWTTDDFIDSKVKGFSLDLNFAIVRETYAYGLSFYDLFSRLYWQNSKNRSIVRRFAFGSQIMRNGYIMSSGITSRLEKKSEHKYHFGLQRNLLIANRKIPVRMGVYSKKFDNAENIFVSFGLGYYIGETFRIDFSAVNHDTNIDNTDYKISFSLQLKD